MKIALGVLAVATWVAFSAAASPAVDPAAAGRLRPINLPDLVIALAPKTTAPLTWAYASDIPQIVWTGPQKSVPASRWTFRHGLARVRVAGQTATDVQDHTELAWDVELSAEPGHDQPTRIGLSAGTEDSPCFGRTTKNCLFTVAQAFASPKIKSRRLCRADDVGDYVEGLSLRIEGRPEVLARFEWSEGSGGASTGLELWPGGDAKALCKT